MKSRRTRKLQQLLAALPINVRRQAYETYQTFKHDPYHPSLHFKRVRERDALYSVHFGLSYHALGQREEDDLIVWFWIGSHADYDKLLR